MIASPGLNSFDRRADRIFEVCIVRTWGAAVLRPYMFYDEERFGGGMGCEADEMLLLGKGGK
jgi:hypothetical protein